MPAPEGHRRKARTRREPGALPGIGPTILTAGKGQLPLPNARSTTDGFHSAKSARRFTVSLIERSAMLAWSSRNVALPRAGLFFCPFFIDTRQAHACAGRTSTKSADAAGARCSSRHRPDNPDSRKRAAPPAERPEHDGRLSFRKIGASFSGGEAGRENRPMPAASGSAAGKCGTGAGRRAGEETPHAVIGTLTCSRRLATCGRAVKGLHARRHGAVSGARHEWFHLTTCVLSPKGRRAETRPDGRAAAGRLHRGLHPAWLRDKAPVCREVFPAFAPG